MVRDTGDRIGPYEILTLLGAGGMGTVYRARDLRLERDVALKFLHSSTDTAGNLTRVLREARAASALNHPSICAVYDVGESEGDGYIAMEYVEGPALSARIPAGGLPTAEVVRIGIETADALAHAHGRGIIHRDLKSANILRDDDGRVKVLDFGLARRVPRDVIEQATQSAVSIEAAGVIGGTLAWMAPEVLRRSVVYFRPDAGPNGDFWIAPVDGSQPPRRLTSDLREGGSPLWTRDDRIIFSSARAGSRTLWQVPATGGTPAPLTTGAGEDDEPELARDGRRLLYSNVRNSWGLMVRNLDGSNETQLLEKRTETIFPQFSPDGTRIAFFGRSDKAVAIFTVGADGTGLRQLTGGIELNHMPRWSADGAYVYFFQINPKLSFRRVPAVGGASEAVLPLNWETENFPQFDPSGRFLSYTLSKPGANDQTILRDMESGAERALPGSGLQFARWSRDGRMLVGFSVNNSVAVCVADGSSCRTLTTGSFPAWSGDGSRIVMLRDVISGGRRELWSIDLEGRDPRRHGDVGPFRVIDTFFDISRQDQIVWGQYRAGRRELWAATVRD